MKKAALFLLTFGVALSCVFLSWDWPAGDAVPVENFGQDIGGGPSIGWSFRSEGGVLCAESGELLYASNGDTFSGLPEPLGNWVAIDHGEGMVSIYARLEREDPVLSEGAPKRPSALSPIGTAGSSGWQNARMGGGKGFFLLFYDREERRWANPAVMLPPLLDTRPPVIESVYLKAASDGTVTQLPQTRTLPQGRYSILVRAGDTRLLPNETPLAPYTIACLVNGVGLGSLSFETFFARDGKLMLYRDGLIAASEVYAGEEGFAAAEIELHSGRSAMDVTATDLAVPPNTHTSAFRFNME
jgi:hypothetical protein